MSGRYFQDEANWPETSAHLEACERALLDPAVRRDRAQVEALLAEDFLEFGSSGQVWDRQTIIDALASQAYSVPAVEQMQCTRIGADVALITYRTARAEADGSLSGSLRSSLWVRDAGRWRIRFHQATRV